MNEKLQRELDRIESLIAIQKNCLDDGVDGAQYMHGMANGMILVHSLFASQQPKFISRIRRPYGRNIRHKSAKSKRNR